MIRLAATRSSKRVRPLELAKKAARRRQLRRGFQFESLELRWLMAADALGNDDVPLSPVQEWTGATGSVMAAQTTNQAFDEDVAEGEDATDLVAFAKALTAAGVKFFAADWCTFCTQQKLLFEDGARYLPFIEVTNPDRSLNQVGTENNITTFPTWQFPDGTRLTGLQTLQTISQRSGVAIPTSSKPTIAPIPDVVLQLGSPRYIPIDAYDPNNGPLTITVTNSNPSVLSVQVPQGNRSLKVSVVDRGEMVFQLFEDKAPVPSSRVIQLAQSGFFNSTNTSSMIFHRVISNFVIQTGDPTGTGTGGSSLSDFDDQFHVDLQHNQAGVLSYAKSSDDTNDSQFFITASPQRLLDFNHSVFGQLVEGDNVRAGINRTTTNSSDRPTRDVKIESASVFNDQENGLVFLKALGAGGESDVTVTVTDQQGNSFAETFHVSIVQDTSNSAPFLQPVAPIKTTVNTPVTFQLQATDIENDAKFFDAVVGGGTNFTFNVNNDTGSITVTPPNNFIGTLDLLVGVRGVTAADTVDQFDTQRLSIAVVPQAPTGVDLLAESDSGASSSDNITNKNTAKIQVTGVSNGAVVKVLADNVVVGQATAQGTTVTVDVNLTGIADGNRTITATQTLNNQTSAASAGLQVRLDRALPTFLSVAPTSGRVGQRLQYNAITVDEAAADATYSLVNAPAGAVIDATTGVLDWTPTTAQRAVHNFSIEVVDKAGNVRRQDLQITVEGEQEVRYRLQTRRSSGDVSNSFQVGEEFFLDVFVADIRVVPHGVVSAFLDVLFPANQVSLVGNVQFGTRYNEQQTATNGNGVIDEAGGVSPLTDTGNTEHLLFTARFRANQLGQVVLQADPADSLPLHDTLVVDQTTAVQQSKILYGSATVAVSMPFTVVNDLFNVDEDSTTNLDVKANDFFNGANTGTLRVSAVGTPDRGGQISVAQDGRVRYQPAANFNGQETFTYSLTDDVSGTLTGTVTVQVQPVNDNPQAVNDSFTGTTKVLEDSQQNVLNVLSNDLAAPDTGETLRVTAVGTRSNSGSVTIAPNGTHLIYTPASNFFGTETFTYTIGDGNGGTATGTVTVEVQNVNDPPLVVNDIGNFNEDSSANEFNPLSNDSSSPDTGENLVITSVQKVGNATGTLTITADGKKVRYTPAANFFGTEFFFYTVSDGNGGSTTATLQMVVAPQNDPPSAVNDTSAAKFTVTKNTTANRLEVARNDSIAPDTGETLTVSNLTTPTAGGSIQVSSDGKAVLYTPPANFVGTDTFQYTINDGNGGTATATTEVEVRNFIPSTIAGFAYVDGNNNGTFDTGETPLGNVKITLQGQDQFGTAVNVSQMTSSNGSYQFTNVAPGNYSLRQTQPEFFHDGRDTIGSHGGSAGNDVITISLPENINATNYNFGELGRSAPFVGFRDLFASNRKPQMFLVVDTASLPTFAANGTWTNVQAPNVSLSSDQRTWNVSVQNGGQSQMVAAFPNRYSSALQVLGSRAGKTLLRIVGRLSDLPFQTVNGTSNGGSGGEGESSRTTASSPASTVQAEAASSVPTRSTTSTAAVDAVMSQWNESAPSVQTAIDFADLLVSARRRLR